MERMMKKFLGWSAYILFGFCSAMIVLMAAGFWPFLSWTILLCFFPRVCVKPKDGTLTYFY
jgi:hypothetical protein